MVRRPRGPGDDGRLEPWRAQICGGAGGTTPGGDGDSARREGRTRAVRRATQQSEVSCKIHGVMLNTCSPSGPVSQTLNVASFPLTIVVLTFSTSREQDAPPPCRSLRHAPRDQQTKALHCEGVCVCVCVRARACVRDGKTDLPACAHQDFPSRRCAAASVPLLTAPVVAPVRTRQGALSARGTQPRCCCRDQSPLLVLPRQTLSDDKGHLKACTQSSPVANANCSAPWNQQRAQNAVVGRPLFLTQT